MDARRKALVFAAFIAAAVISIITTSRVSWFGIPATISGGWGFLGHVAVVVGDGDGVLSLS